MSAKLLITFHDETWDEIELGGRQGLYWAPTPQGLMIKQEGVRGCRTVYPWKSIRKYHIETEAGLRDQERRAAEREEARRIKLFAAFRINQPRSGPVGGCGDVHEPADQGGGGAEGNAAERPE